MRVSIFLMIFYSLATTTSVDDHNDQNGVNGNHQIVLLANEQLEPSDNEQTSEEVDRKTSNGATDEELTPLHWLHDKNLLKGKKILITLTISMFNVFQSFRDQFVMPQSAIT